MIFSNKYFIISAAIVVLQQIVLAISTYFIAIAGNLLSHNDISAVLHYIVLFFITALIAYLLSSYSEFIQVRFKNKLWENYINETFTAIKFKMEVASESNKHLVTNWLAGEAQNTFDNLSVSIIEIIGIYCNVIFTLLVFYIALGSLLASTIAISMLLSVLLLKILKPNIANLANRLQDNRVQVLVKFNSLWDNYLFGNNKLIKTAANGFHNKLTAYFSYLKRYQILEQFIACLPIFIVIPLIIIVLYYLAAHNSLMLGGVIAVLPRSLQLLGNIHALSMHNSKILLMKYKLNNLKFFVSKLDRQNLTAQIRLDKITISNISPQKKLLFAELMLKITTPHLRHGRILIQGSNGSGKSSLLKLLKNAYHETSVLLAPGVNFINDTKASNGEQLLKQLQFILANNYEIVLLDEWDANLDESNVLKVNNKIEHYAKQFLVIEVRHKHPKV